MSIMIQTRKRILLVSLVLVADIFATGFTFAYDPDDIKQLHRGSECVGCDLRSAPLADRDLQGKNLAYAVLTHADLTGARLVGANLTAARLDGAIVDGADFRATILTGASLVDVEMTAVRLAGADLRYAHMPHLDIDVDLEHFDLAGVRLDGAWFKHDIRCGGAPERGGFGCAAR